MIRTLSSKDPNDKIQVYVDFSKALKLNSFNTTNSNTIQTYIVSVNVASSNTLELPVINTSINNTNTAVIFTVSGGLPNVTYKVTTAVDLSDGQQWNHSVYLPVEYK